MAIRYHSPLGTGNIVRRTTAWRPPTGRRYEPRPPLGPGDNEATGDGKMVWETPQAIDLRLGMEITMYVSTR